MYRFLNLIYLYSQNLIIKVTTIFEKYILQICACSQMDTWLTKAKANRSQYAHAGLQQTSHLYGRWSRQCWRWDNWPGASSVTGFTTDCTRSIELLKIIAPFNSSMHIVNLYRKTSSNRARQGQNIHLKNIKIIGIKCYPPLSQWWVGITCDQG